MSVTLRGLCALVLSALHVVGGYAVLVALMMTPEGPWDTGVTQAVRGAAVAGLVVEALAAALTTAFIGLTGLRKWWYVLPAVLASVAVARMVFAPEA